MKKLLLLIIVGVLCYRGLDRLNRTAEKPEPSPQRTETVMAETVLNGEFISILSDEQLDKIAETARSLDVLGEDGLVQSFLQNCHISLEQFYEELRNREDLLNLRESFREYLAEQYCQQKGISRQDASEEEIGQYQLEQVSQLIGKVLLELR